MSDSDPLLSLLVDQLAAMPQLDREVVLAGLSEDECAKLLPLLTSEGDQALSPALTALIRGCQIDQPQSLPPRAAAMLIEAADHCRSALEPRRSAALSNKNSLWNRVAGRWGPNS
jgi:hypothetical protein